MNLPRGPVTVLPDVVSLPERPPASTLAPGTDFGPSVPTCRECGRQLAEGDAYCSACGRSTAAPVPRPPSRTEQLQAALEEQRRQHEAAFAEAVGPEHRLIGALLVGRQEAQKAVADLRPEHFADEGLGRAFAALRFLAATGRYINAALMAIYARQLAEATSTPGSGPFMGRIVGSTPAAQDLERWAHSIRAAEARRVAQDLGAQVRAAGEVRLALEAEREERDDAALRASAPAGTQPCPQCGSWRIKVEEWRARCWQGTCYRCRATWPARPPGEEVDAR